MSTFRMAKVLSVASNFRTNYPWAYTLDCGHVFFGEKSRPKPMSSTSYPNHPKIIRCRECYP